MEQRKKQAGAELCQAQDKLYWINVSKLIKLFKPIDKTKIDQIDQIDKTD